MIVVAAVDDKGGMMFNKRRQSQDKLLREHLVRMSCGKKLWMNLYSVKQFSEMEATSFSLNIAEDFLEQAEKGDVCFVENCSVKNYADKVEKVILYRWNRNYPADFYFDLPLAECGWSSTVTEEFVGNSHEKITVEEWTK